MSGFIVDLLEGIADFFTDVWLLRRQRAARGGCRTAGARTQPVWSCSMAG